MRQITRECLGGLTRCFIKKIKCRYTKTIMIIIQSLLQIILESLPISSSGHLVLLQTIFHWPELTKSFEYVLHAPTILILVIYFRATWIPLLLHCWRFRTVIINMVLSGCVADSVTALVYGCMQLLAPHFPLWIGFATTACMLFSLRLVSYKRDQVTYKKALLIGCMQGIAGLPGISRLASTYVTGVWLGLPAHKAFYFSCMIQFPLICAGFLYGLAKTAGSEWLCASTMVSNYAILALVASSVCAYALLYCVQRCMQEHTLWKFGYYMLLPFCLALVV